MKMQRWYMSGVAALALALAPVGAGASGTWTSISSMKVATAQQTATPLFGGVVLMAGGVTCNTSCTALSSAQIYVPSKGKWYGVYPMTTPRFDHSATLLPNGQVLVAGGCSTAASYYCANALSSAELFNPKTLKWTATGAMTAARQGQSATLLRTGQVLIAGGQGDCPPTCAVLSSAELYNPSTGTFTPTGSMHEERQNQTATLLPNGQVLVTGGYGCAGVCSDAELYNPSTGTWTLTTGHMTINRTNHTATLLPNGQVLIAGGMQGCNYGCAVLASAELYNPSTGTFTPTGSLATARYLHTATLLTNGSVLVTGGANVYGAIALSSAEVYSPTTGAWTSAGTMHAARAFQTATLLTSGPLKYQVLVAGGYNFQNSANTFNSAEVYHP